MDPFTRLEGPAAPLLLANIDTDVIIRIERLTAGDRAALGGYAFESLRFQPDGAENPDFILNQSLFRTAPILLAGPNFGCGSSREGAVWALAGRGVRCVIADGFGDIFASNCFQNGVLPISLPEATVLEIAAAAQQGAPMTVDLAAQTVAVGNHHWDFPIDPHRKQALLEGLDDLGLSLKAMPEVRDWQRADQGRRPWLWRAVALDAGHPYFHPTPLESPTS